VTSYLILYSQWKDMVCPRIWFRHEFWEFTVR